MATTQFIFRSFQSAVIEYIMNSVAGRSQQSWHFLMSTFSLPGGQGEASEMISSTKAFALRLDSHQNRGLLTRATKRVARLEDSDRLRRWDMWICLDQNLSTVIYIIYIYHIQYCASFCGDNL